MDIITILLSFAVTLATLKGVLNLSNASNNTWPNVIFISVMFSIFGAFAIGPLGIFLLVGYLLIMINYFSTGLLWAFGAVIAQIVTHIGLAMILGTLTSFM